MPKRIVIKQTILVFHAYHLVSPTVFAKQTFYDSANPISHKFLLCTSSPVKTI